MATANSAGPVVADHSTNAGAADSTALNLARTVTATGSSVIQPDNGGVALSGVGINAGSGGVYFNTSDPEVANKAIDSANKANDNIAALNVLYTKQVADTTKQALDFAAGQTAQKDNATAAAFASNEKTTAAALAAQRATSNDAIGAINGATSGALKVASSATSDLADVASNSIGAAKTIAGESFDFAGDSQSSVLAFSKSVLSAQNDLTESTRLGNNQLASNLAASASALETQKASTPDDRLLTLGKMAIYAGAVVFGLFFLLGRQKSSA